jgi:3-methyl-2-oxobutanoate hydroxymethyltransferase
MELCLAWAGTYSGEYFFHRVTSFDPVQEYITKQTSMETVTIPTLQQMKFERRKIVAVVGWDYQIARIADRAGVEIISVGDSVGVNLWGRQDDSDITVDEMIIVCRAVRRGTRRALVSCDLPSRLLEKGVAALTDAAQRMVQEAGADLVKVDRAAELPDAVTAITRTGIPVFAQFEMAGHDTTASVVNAAKRLEEAGAALIDFKHSGPVAGSAVANAVRVPVLGGMGGGPWLDGRIRLVHAAIGYAASTLESQTENYANVAEIALDALAAYADDVRSGRQIKG